MKQLRFILVAAPLYIFFGLFATLPPVTASNLGGFIARSIGPKLAASRKARRNIELAFPNISSAEKDKIIKDMWDNLGRVMAELPHIEKIARSRVTIKNGEIVKKAFDSGQGGIFISGHLANWEMHATSLMLHYGVMMYLTYREPNNPYSGWLLKRARTLNGRLPGFPKARSSAKHLINVLRDKKFLGILIDQKYNEGLAVPFFGQPAMTNPVFVTLCQKYKCPLIPIQCVRTGPAQFELTIQEPLAVLAADGSPLPVEDVIQTSHAILEDWIRQNPGQWIWLHRRWDSKVLKD